MVFIYEKETGEIKAFYQGDIPQIHNFGNEAEGWAEAQFPDVPEVLRNPHDYKVVVYNGLPITYQKKPELKLTVDKEEIIGDGEDFAVLKTEITGVHPLEEERYGEVAIQVNEQRIVVGNGEEIEVASHGVDVIITGDMNGFRGDRMRRRITVGEMLLGRQGTNQLEAMQTKLAELERRINMLSKSEGASPST